MQPHMVPILMGSPPSKAGLLFQSEVATKIRMKDIFFSLQQATYLNTVKKSNNSSGPWFGPHVSYPFLHAEQLCLYVKSTQHRAQTGLVVLNDESQTRGNGSSRPATQCIISSCGHKIISSCKQLQLLLTSEKSLQPIGYAA